MRKRFILAFVAGAIAFDYVPEFIPVDLPEIVMFSFLIPFQVRVGNRHAQDFYLLSAHVHKVLSQLVVAFPFDLPFHTLIGIGRFGISWSKHHQ